MKQLQRLVGPSTTGLFMYLMPPYGVMMAVVFLGEELHAYHFAGFVLIMSGLVLATAPPWLIARIPFADRLTGQIRKPVSGRA